MYSAVVFKGELLAVVAQFWGKVCFIEVVLKLSWSGPKWSSSGPIETRKLTLSGPQEVP